DIAEPAPQQEAATAATPTESLLSAAGLSTGQGAGATVKAEIMDIAQAASGEVWAVAVRFSQGACEPCRVEVHDADNGQLLTSDEVRGVPAGNGIHETQFEYR